MTSCPMMPCRVAHLLRRRARLAPDVTAIVCGGERLSYSDLNRRTNATARLLRTLGVTRGDRVAVLGRNSVAYVELYFAVAELGAVLCGLNFRLAVPELHDILQDSGAKLIFAEAEFVDVVLQAAGSGVATFAIGSGTNLLAYEGLRDQCPAEELDVDVDADDPLVIVYTSGTTGRVKGAVLTQSQMYWSSATQLASLDFRQRDVNLIAAPMFHVGGLSFATLFVHLGATALLLRQWNAGDVLRLIAKEHVNHFFAVPSMLKTLLEQLGGREYELGSLRWVLTGGAPTPPELIRSLAAFGIPVLQSYGSTETGGPASCLDADRFLAKAGSVGRPYFHTDIRVVDAERRVLRPTQIGEIQLRAPHVFKGYWGNAEATRATFDGEWLRMGDLGWFDDGGDLHIAGRAKEMIITGGENVYPAEVELVLQAHPDIAEVAVIGTPHPEWGEAICAVVVPCDGKKLTLAELRHYCEGQLARYKIPRMLELRDAPLPRNASGKILKYALLAEIAEPSPRGRST